MVKIQPAGTEAECPEGRLAGVAAGIWILSVFSVTQEGESMMRHLHPDLMVPSGIQMDLNDRIRCGGIRLCFESAIVEPRMLCARGIGRADAGCVGTSVPDQIVFQICF